MFEFVGFLALVYLALRFAAWLDVELFELAPGRNFAVQFRLRGMRAAVGLSSVSVVSGLDHFHMNYVDIFPRFISMSRMRYIDWEVGWLGLMTAGLRVDLDMQGAWFHWWAKDEKNRRGNSYVVVTPKALRK